MKILLVDDEEIALKHSVAIIKELYSFIDTVAFRIPSKALVYITENRQQINLAIIDIQMYQMDGLTLAKKIKEIDSSIPIIFLTGHTQYAIDAFKVRATGYLLKPASKEDFKIELEHIKEYKNSNSKKNRIRIQTFGNFEVYVDENQVKFSRARTKELFAYLISKRGTNATVRELAAVLWEDAPSTISLQSNLRNLVSDLIKTLKNLGLEDVVIKSRGLVGLNIKKIDCDYYNFLDGDIDAINTYCGEFMSQYSWAEFIISYLNRKI